LRIEFLPDLDSLALIRLVLRRTLPDLKPDVASSYYSAVTEILTNAIHAHRDADLEAPIEVGVRLEAPPAVTISDRGRGFDPTEVISGRDDFSGNGLRIATTVCPQMTIASDSNGTTVTMPFPEADEST